MPFAFNAVELYVVTVNGKHWTRAKEVCKALEYQKTTKTAQVVRAHCSRENIRHMRELKRGGFSKYPFRMAKKQPTRRVLHQRRGNV